MENHKSESENLNQLKKWLTAKGDANFSDLSNKACWLLEEIVQNLQQRFPENYRHTDIELLENCKHLSEFCTWNELDLNKFKADCNKITIYTAKSTYKCNPPCKSLRQREKCCAGEAKLRHFLGLVLIF